MNNIWWKLLGPMMEREAYLSSEIRGALRQYMMYGVPYSLQVCRYEVELRKLQKKINEYLELAAKEEEFDV